MNIKNKLNSYINALSKASKLETEIRDFYITKYGEGFYNLYIEDMIRDNVMKGDLEETLRLIDKIIREMGE